MLFDFMRTWDVRREYLCWRAPAGAMKDYYRNAYPWPEDDYREQEYVALDLETTGLMATQHEIVSFGWVVIKDMRIDLAQCGHQLVKPSGGLTAQSAAIHGITDDQLRDAPTLKEALEMILPVLSGRVMVAHHAKVEWKFTDAACRRIFGIPFEIPTVDTMKLELQTYKNRAKEIGQGELRLDAVRKRYNLPRYRAHNAMIDAIACGELFLAQAQHRYGDKAVPLRQLSI